MLLAVARGGGGVGVICGGCCTELSRVEVVGAIPSAMLLSPSVVVSAVVSQPYAELLSSEPGFLKAESGRF
jgi:hypothetical protein